MVNPNFLLIGAQKCGTSWLSKMISAHPDIFAPSKKELHFFNKQSNYDRGMLWYRSLFSGYNGEKAIGESTPNYFWTTTNEAEIEESGRTHNVPKLIHEHYPNIKLIVSLRDPVQRAISAYYHNVRARRIAPTQPLKQVWHKYGIISMGLYHSQLCNWLTFYPINQFLILIYENDIAQNKKSTLRRVYRFLGVDDTFEPEHLQKQYNARAGHLYMRLHYYFPFLNRFIFIKRLLRTVNFPQIRITSDEVDELSRIFANENRKLKFLIERNIDTWRGV